MSPLPPDIAERLAARAGRLGPFGRVPQYHACVSSTNDEAARLAEAGAPEGAWVVADEQTAGRGRRGRTWISPPGAGLYLSVVFRPVAAAREAFREALPPGMRGRGTAAAARVGTDAASGSVRGPESDPARSAKSDPARSAKSDPARSAKSDPARSAEPDAPRSAKSDSDAARSAEPDAARSAKPDAARGAEANATAAAGPGAASDVGMTSGGGATDARATTLLTLMAGVAAATGVRIATGLAPTLKWPNDLVIEPPGDRAGFSRFRKLAGILAEASATGSELQFVVIGIGINLTPAAYPPDVAARATSIEGELGRPADRALVLVEVLSALADGRRALLEGRADDVLQAWRVCAPSSTGRRVRWTAGSRSMAGVTQGVDDGGALLVRTDTGTERIIAGDLEWD